MQTRIYHSDEQRQIWRVVPDLIRARELLRDLITKDFRVKYRYAAMGVAWAVIEPLALTFVLSFVFVFVFPSRVSGTPGAEAPFPVSLLCALIFWQFSASALSAATVSLVTYQDLVKKNCFAREIIPLSMACYPLINLCLGFVILIAMHLSFGGGIGWSLALFPLVFIIQFVMTAGLALLFSCSHVLFRDVGYMVNVALLFGFYATPIFYRLEWVMAKSSLPEAVQQNHPWLEPLYPWLQRLYLLNPMAELMTAYRQMLFESRFPDLWLLGWPAVMAALALALGVTVFRRNAALLSDHL